MSGPHRDLRVERVSQAYPALLGDQELLYKGLVDFFVYEEVFSGGAALTGAEKGGVYDGVRGCVEVCIVEDDEGTVPAHLQDLCFAGGLVRQLFARLLRSR